MIYQKALVLAAIFLAVLTARADVTPVVRTDVIDSDAQVSPTQWRSSALWIWSQNHLRLQTVIEIPAHLVALLPPELAPSLRGSEFKGPFSLQDDHRFLVIEMRGPTAMYRLGPQTLRISVEFDHTNWMRSPSCRGENVYLNENRSDEPKSEAPQPPLFISLFCKTSNAGTWIEVASSDEVSLSFDVTEQTRIKTADGGTEFWLPKRTRAAMGTAVATGTRTLADIAVLTPSDDVVANYQLLSEFATTPSVPTPEPTSEAVPIPLLVPDVAVSTAPLKVDKHETFIGIDAQMISAYGALDSARTSRSSAEASVTAHVTRTFSERVFGADLEMPIRRLGAGLDAKGAGSSFGYLLAAYEFPRTSPNLTWRAGLETSILDVRSSARSSVYSLSPSVEAKLGRLTTVSLAPFDFISNLSVARVRTEWPLTPDRKNRLTFEGVLARTVIQPQTFSWNVNGLTVGFAGEF